MSDQPETEDSYLASLKGAEYFAIIARANMAFRYGPYTAPEVGQIMSQCVDEGIPLHISAVCGREFDWELARDFGRGEPANWQPMDLAPKDGTIVLGDVTGFEQRMCWWNDWECWRLVDEDGTSLGNPVTPFRWRPA